jgi:aminobenzoyl-glutamate transport protein
VVVLGGVVLAGVLPAGGYLNNPRAPGWIHSVFMEGLVTFLFLFGLVPGLVYGRVADTLRNDHDVVAGMVRTMQAMATFIVLAFFAAQFIAYFNWTRLGLILAVKGAAVIEALNLRDWPVLLMAVLVLFAAAVNLLISSASAKWALLAPVFVPLFMLVGYSPELVQAAFRVGDSVTNIVTPLMSYFPLILTFAQRYEPRAGLGTLIALMVPYSVAFLAAWLLLTVAWIALGLPVGPGAPLYLESAGAAAR